MSQEAPPGEELDMKPKMEEFEQIEEEEEQEEVFEDEDPPDDDDDDKAGFRDLDDSSGEADNSLPFAGEYQTAAAGKRFDFLLNQPQPPLWITYGFPI